MPADEGALEHPYRDLPAAAKWLKGNLHAHSTLSDGKRDPQEVIDAYRGLGYDFLALTDHDTLASEPEYRQWASRGLALIPGNEISARGPHLLHIGGSSLAPPHEDRQRAIDEAVASGGFVVCNHPNWQKQFNHFPFELLSELQGYVGLEIFNGTIGRLPGSPYATDKWDRLLSERRRVWGFATDDSHMRTEDTGLGWIVVCDDKRDPASLVESMRKGRFYASTGIAFESIAASGDRVRVTTREKCRLVAVADHGRRVAVADGRELEVALPDQASYVRVECWGEGEAFAWTQPFFRMR